MAITLADFNKIWSSTSPLSPYTFSDDNYNEGWNFIGQIPPSRQMWDFLQKNNDEKMQYLANNYLPISGGALTGNLGFNGTGGAFITRNINTNRLEIMGGTAWNTSASLVLSGKDRDGGANGGIFELFASIDNNPKKLVGKPDGTLQWDGNNILTASNYNSYALPLSGGTMTGRINSFGADNREFKMGLSGTSATSCDIGWDFGTFAGAMFSLRSASYGSSDAGGFNLYARKDNNNAVLTGLPDGTLKWNGYDITPYGKKGNAPSITVPEGTYILVAFQYGYGVPSQNICYVGLIGGQDFNDGTQHIGAVDIIKGSSFAGLGLSYSITTDNTKQITVSLTAGNSNISLIKVWANT